jgi:predicted RNA methylase
MKRILKSELDKFYTKEEVSKKIIATINLDDYDLIVDPSCGDGSFFNNINKNKIGIDIDHTLSDNNIIKTDFLKWDYNNIIKNDSSRVLAITNPPFGKQGSLALKFIKKCSLFSDTIAFILPLSFAKDSMKNKIPIYYHLIYQEILSDNSFLLNNEDYQVKCVYQVWKKKPYKREIIKKIPEVGFTYTKDKNKADIAIRRVGIYAGMGFLETNKSEQSHYFIILNDKKNKNKVLEDLKTTKWNDLTVGPRSISKSELNLILNKICQH